MSRGVKEIPDAPLRPIDRAAGWFILAVGCLGTLIALGLIGYGLVTRDASDLIIGPLAAGGAVWLTVLTLRAFRRDTRVLMPGIQARLESAIARANAEPPAQPRVRFPGDEQVATLMVRRTMGGSADRERAYELRVDGQFAGELHQGQGLRVGLSPGRHVVHFQIDWCRSRRIPFVIAPDETLALVCAPAANPVTVMLMITILCKRYIKVRVDADTPRSLPDHTDEPTSA